jgi:hypothetical protein
MLLKSAVDLLHFFDVRVSKNVFSAMLGDIFESLLKDVLRDVFEMYLRGYL